MVQKLIDYHLKQWEGDTHMLRYTGVCHPNGLVLHKTWVPFWSKINFWPYLTSQSPISGLSAQLIPVWFHDLSRRHKTHTATATATILTFLPWGSGLTAAIRAKVRNKVKVMKYHVWCSSSTKLLARRLMVWITVPRIRTLSSLVHPSIWKRKGQEGKGYKVKMIFLNKAGRLETDVRVET